MTNNARRKKAKRKQRHARSIPVAEIDPASIATPLRRILEQAEVAEYYLGAERDLDAAATRATADLHEAAERLANLCDPYDAFDILDQVRQSQWPLNPETYSETEHEGNAAVIELVALLLAARGRRAGALPDEDGHRASAAPVFDDLLDAANDAVQAGTAALAARSAAQAAATGSGMMSLNAVLREVFLRNMAYPHMVRDTLVTLFGDPELEAVCRAEVGVTVDEVVAVFDAFEQAYIDAFGERMDRKSDFALFAKAEMEKAVEAGTWPPPTDRSDDDPRIDDETRERARAMFDAAFADPGDACVLDIDDIARRSGIGTATVELVIDLFALTAVTGTPSDIADCYFAGRSPLRVRPILRADDGTAMVVNPVLLFPAIRERVEEALKHTPGWNIYSKKRGSYLEDEAVRLLTNMLPGADVLTSIEYFVPDPKSAVPQQHPADYTKLVEGDGLVIVDDIAFVIEAKAGAMSSFARAGDAKKLRQDLQKLIAEAADQGNRTRDGVLRDGGLRLRDGTWLDLGHIREMHVIAVTLDDMSGVATITSELVRSGLLAYDTLPWTVSLHDLRLVSELVDRPAELLLFLRRRTSPDVVGAFQALDELDYFLEFFNGGLWAEPDPDQVEVDLPEFGPQPVSARRRHKDQGVTFLLSRTDTLDAYIFHQLGQRRTPAPKPTRRSDPTLLAIVDTLATERQPGWLGIGATLLNSSAKTQRTWGRQGARLVQQTRRDGRPHTAMMMGGPKPGETFVLIWRSEGRTENETRARRELDEYVKLKKHQFQLARGYGMLFDTTSPTHPVYVTYDNSRPQPDEELDAQVAARGLRGPGQLQRAMPTPAQLAGRRRV